MVYSAEAVLLTDIEYGAPPIRAYNEKGDETSLEDTSTSWMKVERSPY